MWRWKSNHRNNHQWQNSTRRLALTHCLGFEFSQETNDPSCCFGPPVRSRSFGSYRGQLLTWCPLYSTATCRRIFWCISARLIEIALIKVPSQTSPFRMKRKTLPRSGMNGRQRLPAKSTWGILPSDFNDSNSHQSPPSIYRISWDAKACKNCAKVSNLYNLDQFN